MHEKSHIQLNLLNDTEKQISNESTSAAECQQFTLSPPVDGENSKQCYARRRKVSNQIKSKDIEDSLIADCHKRNVQYIPRVDGENQS